MEITNEQLIEIKYMAKQEGINEGLKHIKSAPETVKELNHLKINMSEINTKLDTVIDSVKELKECDKNNAIEHKEIRKDLRDFIDATKDRFVDKETYKADKDSNRIEHEKVEKIIAEFIESANTKYSPIEVADTMKTVKTTVIGALVLALLGLIFVNK